MKRLISNDEKERQRQERHTALRNACTQGEPPSVIRAMVQGLGQEAELIINMAPNGSNTLLFTACESGLKETVKVLLANEADGRIHPVTKYSPLYIACYYGKRDIVELLLKKFPELVQQQTVEKWLPIHACCINGHVALAEQLLRFPYPSHIMQKFVDQSGQWEYELPFDINHKDVTGQTSLYQACYLGNKKLVDLFLKYKVKAYRIKPAEEKQESEEESESVYDAVSPTRRRISHGIQSIMSKLNLNNGELWNNSEVGLGGWRTGRRGSNARECMFSPLQVNIHCNNGAETALHAAVREGHHSIVNSLLSVGGADPNLPIRSDPQSGADDTDEEGSQSAQMRASSVRDDGVSTALTEACKNRDVAMVELLLRHSARDDRCQALRVALSNGDEGILALLLATKAHRDPEYKVNAENGSSNGARSSNSSPAAVMINWHGQRDLTRLRTQWLVDAALAVNPSLRAARPQAGKLRHLPALNTITRLDISDNSLKSLPVVIFSMHSLRYLNVAQNKIEKLPSRPHVGEEDGLTKLQVAEGLYTAPVLEEILLQNNRLEEIPEDIFLLPALVSLDVSNNKLQVLPHALWQAPKLKELNAAFNLLRDLPLATPPSVASPMDPLLSSHSSMSSLSIEEALPAGEQTLDVPKSLLVQAESLQQAMQKAKVLRHLELRHHTIWRRSVEVSEQVHCGLGYEDGEDGTIGGVKLSQLSALNLAHNAFTRIPHVLPCLAVNLTRLNMSYNNLRSMGHITSYPGSLKQLDLSHNQICCWPSLPQLVGGPIGGHSALIGEGVDPLAAIACYAPPSAGQPPDVPLLTSPTSDIVSGKIPSIMTGRRTGSGLRSIRSVILNAVCVHRRHLRLDNLRTLILADNMLTRIQLSTDDDGGGSTSASPSPCHMPPDDDDHIIGSDELFKPSVCICELPPQMGLLSRLWNLSTRGCSLQEPLRSMIDSKKYKTMDVVGYLKSVLEDARPYARMKLMIVGVQGIGKTSLLEQLRMEGSVGSTSGAGGGGTGASAKKKQAEHWTKRMGNKNVNMKTPKGTNISTVGVDICDWVYEKKIRGQSSFGPVIFRTWDFGGQREYYATHQYFLSKRSLYLVVWRIPDGQRGISEILQWLVNIQARAPNSPVIIVGTHYDMMRDPSSMSEDLQQMIRDRFINIVDAEKCGLPRVLDTIEVSCKTRHNIKLLCNLIYDTVFSLRPPGSKELLLEQRVPASYLALEEVVGHIAWERRMAGGDPVLTAEQYRAAVTKEMLARHHRTFRDSSELNQATAFLHENGVMKLDDLKHVFKSSSPSLCANARGYIVSLLNKFEVALTWDSRTLLIPSLLPSEEQIRSPHSSHLFIRVKIPIRTRGWAGRNKKLPISGASTIVGNSLFYPQSEKFKIQKPVVKGPAGTTSISAPSSGPLLDSDEEVKAAVGAKCELTHRGEPELSVRRLLLMSYFPSGFWSRLTTRILADDAIVQVVRSYFVLPKEVTQDQRLVSLLDVRAEWILWQTGMELRYLDTTLFRMKEVLSSMRNTPVDYRQLRFCLKQEGIWSDVDLNSSSILEIYFPVDTVVIKRPIVDETCEDEEKASGEPIGYQAIVLDPSPECIAKLLALVVDHIDILLEDWYPTLGTRFVHTSEGRFLVTRLVPCPRCLSSSLPGEWGPSDSPLPHQGRSNQNTWMLASPLMPEPLNVSDHGLESSSERQHQRRCIRKSQESYTSDGDSGVGPDSAGSSRNPSVEGHPGLGKEGDDENPEDAELGEEMETRYTWMVEECILAACERPQALNCPAHGDLQLAQIAPDTVFLDLGERFLIRPENIRRGALLGRGAFGFVFRGTCRLRGPNTWGDVAMKMLQPVQPGVNARASALIAYKVFYIVTFFYILIKI
ncbi:hypothetical protein J437_LFUL005999, partial [Ladona fulva]